MKPLQEASVGVLIKASIAKYEFIIYEQPLLY